MARIGVFICHCGTNIGGVVDIPRVLEAARKMPMVTYVDENKYTCSEPGQASVRDGIIKNKLNRVVIGNCSPRMHENTFRKTVASAGLNPYLMEIANLREHCSWVHGDGKEAATAKAIELIKMAIAKVVRDEALFPKQFGLTKRALVIGGGIAGIQAALDIANSGYEVVLVEREPTIGGRMAQLDKTFPTLDCSACILTPKMVDVAQHPNITLLSCSELEEVKGFVGNFEVKIKKKARYVDESKCTACGDCSKQCPVEVSSEFNVGLGMRKAIYIPFPQAVPNKYVIDKEDRPPCRETCPITQEAAGYVGLVARGRFEDAARLIREQNPLPLVCGRVCYHPCESECNRQFVDESIAIKNLKRFVIEWEMRNKGGLEPPQVEKRKPEKIAIIGSGPSGLTCAHELALKGYESVIFEKLPVAGGMLAVGIPEYRLPKNLLELEIDYIRKMGVTIKTGVAFGRDLSLEDLFSQGFKAIYIATGAHKSLKMSIPGEEEFSGIYHGVDFLRNINLGKLQPVGKRVAIIGGGNTAIDAARTALRCGGQEVTILYRRTRKEMPAEEAEIQAAEEEGIKIQYLRAPVEVLGKEGEVTSLKCIKMELGEPDSSGRRRPVPIEGSEYELSFDAVIIAVSQSPELDFINGENRFKISKWNTLEVDPETQETNIKGVFAGGDVVHGPATVISAMGDGKRAAEAIDKYLSGEPLRDFKTKKPKKLAKRDENSRPHRFAPQFKDTPRKPRQKMKELNPETRITHFNEVEIGFTEEEAVREASRCLNCGICIECRECVEACEAGSINHGMRDEIITTSVGAIIVATGYKTFDPIVYGEYGGGKFPDVITGLQLERLLSASGPTGGEVIRPSDSTHPKTVVFISCVGSRDEKKGRTYCSKFCCMYMAKHAIMLKEHDPEVQCYIFYIDVRAGGKDFDEFARRAQREYGALYLRGRVSHIFQDGKKLVVCGEDSLMGQPVEIPADLVVLATGAEPSDGAAELAQTLKISYDTNHFFIEAHLKLRPVETQTDGIYLAGTCVGPRDIPESVAQGGAAAAKVTALFSQDYLTADPMVSTIDATKCSGCLLCQKVCPFKAIETQVLRDGRQVSKVNESLCKGCGLCVTACVFGAANLRGFTQQQLLAEVISLWQ